MPKKFIIIGVIVVVVVVIGAVALSGGGARRIAPQPVELVWWKTFEDPENIQDLIGAYTTLNKNVTIRYVKKDVTQYEKELIEAIAAGKGPDIMTIHNDWLPKHKDKLVPVPSTVMTERQFRETFLDVTADDFIDDAQIWALPMSVDALALYYNKDILNSVGVSQPPTTWTELTSAVQKITQQDRNGDFTQSGVAMGLAGNVNRAVDIVSLLMLQNGTQFYNNNNDVTIEQSITIDGQSFTPAADALEVYTQFANPGKKAYTWNAKTNNSVDAFSQNKLGMMLSYSYMRDLIVDKAPNLNWGVAPVPQVSNSGIRINFANYWGESVSKQSKNQAVAWDFLKFITQKDMLTTYYAKHKLPASRKDMITSQFADIEIGVFAESVLTSKSVRKEDASLFEGIFIKMVEDVVLRGTTPQEAVQNAGQQLRLVERNE